MTREDAGQFLSDLAAKLRRIPSELTDQREIDALFAMSATHRFPSDELCRVVRLYCDHDKMTDAEKVSAIANHPYFASSTLENQSLGLADAHSKNPPEAEHNDRD